VMRAWCEGFQETLESDLVSLIFSLGKGRLVSILDCLGEGNKPNEGDSKYFEHRVCVVLFEFYIVKSVGLLYCSQI
jgi:hypothetical protein